MLLADNQKIFDEGFIDSTLKKPNLFTEAVIYDEISRRPYSQIKEFYDSPEARDMVAAGVISQDVVERLQDIPRDRRLGIASCHLADENDDPLWQQLIAARREERRIMNELLEKYGNSVDRISGNIRDEIINKKLPTKFIMHER